MIGKVKGIIKPVDKEKVLSEFREKYIDNRWIIEFSKINDEYKKNKNVIEEKLKSEFDSMCKLGVRLQEQGIKGKIRYIYFSFLRTSLFKNKGIFKIDLYDEYWFFDKAECSIKLELNFIYNSFFQHMQELKERKREYGRSITDVDIEDIMLEEADKYYVLAVEFLKNIIEKLIQVQSYEKMKKSKEINIIAGEYMGASEIIYPKQDTN